MPRRSSAPDVLDGLREPSNYPDRSTDADVPEASAAYPPIPKVEGPKPTRGGTRHYSLTNGKRGLLILIKKPRLIQIDGEVQEIDGKQARFVDGRFQTEDTEIIAFLDSYMKRNPGCGYVDAEEFAAQVKKDAEDAWLANVQANPELREKLKVALGVKTFDLEGAPTAG